MSHLMMLWVMVSAFLQERDDDMMTCGMLDVGALPVHGAGGGDGGGDADRGVGAPPVAPAAHRPELNK